MIKTVIIDDEPYLRQYISSCISEQNSNYQIIGDAGNGVDAIELIANKRPDVIFLDIKMPVLDGLQVVEEVSEISNYRPFIVILSGYSEFEYAQKALRLNVFDYLLKPLDLNILKNLLEKIHNLLYEKKNDMKLQCLNALIHHDSLTLGQHDTSLCFSEYHIYHAFYLCIGPYCIYRYNQFSISGTVNIEAFLDELLVNTLNDACDFWILNGEHQNEFFIIISEKSPHALADIHKFGNRLYLHTQKNFSYVTLVEKKQIPTFNRIQDSILELKHYAKTYSIFGYSTYFSIGKSEQTTLYNSFLSSTEQKQLQYAAENNQYAVLMEYIKIMLCQCEENKCTQQILENFLKRICQLINHNKYSMSVNEKIDELLSASKNYSELLQNMKELISELCHNVLSAPHTHTIEHVRLYIDEHFTEPLSLDILSGKFGFSICYLSTLFKKTYHVSLNEYIIKKRIQRAEELLITAPNLNIKTIAEIVGYTDSYYFSRIFKSTTGKSPSSYR